MKYITTTLIMFFSLNSFANDLKWVDEQIQAIKPPRSGAKRTNINSLKNPFIHVKKEVASDKPGIKAKTTSYSKSTLTNSSNTALKKTKDNKTKPFTLNAIMNNSALINGKWYKVKDKIGRYTLQAINKTDVILQYKSKTLTLSTNQRSKNIKFKNE